MNKMSKSEVYSWRVSRELKAQLEAAGTSATNERVREVMGEYLEAKYGRRHTR